MVDLRVWNTTRRGLTAGSLMTYFRPARFQAAFPWLLALLAVGYIAFHWSDPVTLAPAAAATCGSANTEQPVTHSFSERSRPYSARRTRRRKCSS